MTLDKFKAELDKYFGLKSILRQEKLVYLSPTGVELFTLTFTYSDKDKAHKLTSVKHNFTVS